MKLNVIPVTDERYLRLLRSPIDVMVAMYVSRTFTQRRTGVPRSARVGITQAAQDLLSRPRNRAMITDFMTPSNSLQLDEYRTILKSTLVKSY